MDILLHLGDDLLHQFIYETITWGGQPWRAYSLSVMAFRPQVMHLLVLLVIVVDLHGPIPTPVLCVVTSPMDAQNVLLDKIFLSHCD
jgi:hypothetical protein